MEERYAAVVPTPRYFLDLISCRSGCPVRTNAGAYVRAVAQGEYRRGYDIAAGPNAWVSACAHVCAHPCESCDPGAEIARAGSESDKADSVNRATATIRG